MLDTNSDKASKCSVSYAISTFYDNNPGFADSLYGDKAYESPADQLSISSSVHHASCGRKRECDLK